MRNKKGEEQWQRVYVQCFTAYPHKLVSYCQPIEGRERSKAQVKNEVNLQHNSTEGIISEKARKRIEVALYWLLLKAKVKKVWCNDSGRMFSFKINFITLTLPAAQEHSDEEIKSVVLKSFLDKCVRSHGLQNYIWRAEAQANGNVHFHLTTDVFIHYKKIQSMWNDSCELLGYVSKFESKWHHREPNSTDVHSVKHVKDIARYLSKYISKHREFQCIGELRSKKGQQFEMLYGSREYRAEEGGKKRGRVIGHVLGGRVRRITGRLWFLSRSLSAVKPIRVNEEMHELKSVSDLIHSGKLREWSGEHVRMWFGDVVAAAEEYSPLLRDEFKKRKL